MRAPTPDAIAAARAVASRNHTRTAQLRRSFIERDNVLKPTPLATLLRGGQGGQVRLKVFLSMLWLAGGAPYDVAYPARAWATLLDLDDPAGKGARRVNEALSWLEKRSFVDVEAMPGHPHRVTLRDETGSGADYRPPGEVYNRGKTSGVPAADLLMHRYVQVAPALWTSGWFAVLSAPALAMYLVLLCEQASKPLNAELWFSPEAATLKYSLSADTRTLGLRELRRGGLVRTYRRPVSGDVFEVQRYRNVYVLVPDQLNNPAAIPDKNPPSRSPEWDALISKSSPAAPEA